MAPKSSPSHPITTDEKEIQRMIDDAVRPIKWLLGSILTAFLGFIFAAVPFCMTVVTKMERLTVTQEESARDRTRLSLAVDRLSEKIERLNTRQP